MDDERRSRVVTDDEGNVRAKTDAEIVKDNESLELEFKEKSKKQMIEDALAEKKLARKAAAAAKAEEDMTLMVVADTDRSLNVGVIGMGQAGSKIAEEFYGRGYNTVCINTAKTDLHDINVPERQKLLLDYALGGVGKDIVSGAEAIDEFSDAVFSHIEKHTSDCDVLMLCTSLAGGSGSGGAPGTIELMTELDKPIIVLAVLPLSSEGTLAKHNSVQTLSKLSAMAADDTISSLIIVDNAKIESIYSGLSVVEFWNTANSAIVEPLHIFNTLTNRPSPYGVLDAMDFSSILVGTGDAMLYGKIDVDNYTDEDAIAEAIVMNVESGLLSSGFDLEQTRAAGVIITGSEEALSKTAATSIEYGMSMLSKICGDGTKIFRGIYAIEGHPDTLTVYSMFSGLGLPEERVAELQEEAERHMNALSDKEGTKSRASNMNINLGKTKTTNSVDKLHNKIKSKRSAMGKLKRHSGKKVVDKRRR